MAVKLNKKVTFTGVSQLALECGMSQPLVTYHIRRGKTPDEVREFAKANGYAPQPPKPAGEQNRAAQKSYRVTTTTEATRHHTSFSNLRRGQMPSIAEAEREIADEVAKGNRVETFMEAQARKERALANKNELHVAEKMGLLVPVQPFRAWLTGIAVKARDILMGIGADLQDQLAIETNPVACKQMVDEKMGRALNELAKFADLGRFQARLAAETEADTEPEDEDEAEEQPVKPKKRVGRQK